MTSNFFREITQQYFSSNNMSPQNTSQFIGNSLKIQPQDSPLFIKVERPVVDHTRYRDYERKYHDENIKYPNLIQNLKPTHLMKLNPISQTTRQGFIDINPNNLFNQKQQMEIKEISSHSSTQNNETSKRDIYHQNQQGASTQIIENYNLYQEAKKCELHDQDLDGAVYYYKKCLEFNQKRDSALKDLATVYHKQGKTQQALDLLLKEKENYQGDIKTYENLIITLEKQLVPTGKVYLKFILLMNQKNEKITNDDISTLFPKIKKIKQIHYFRDLSLLNPIESDQPLSHLCLLEFNSYSNAKKVIEGSFITPQSHIKCFFVDIMGKVKIHIIDNKNYDRELIEYQNPFLQPTTFSQSLVFIYSNKGSSETINSDDKKYTWLQDQALINSKKSQQEFYQKTRKLENELIIQRLLKQSQQQSNNNNQIQNNNK